MRLERTLRWLGLHLASLTFGLLLAVIMIAAGNLIDSAIRHAMGYRLYEDSLGSSAFAALLYFGIASALLAFKVTTGAAPPGEWRPHAHLTGIRPRLVALLICLLVGSAISGASTKELEDGVTYMTGAVLGIVPIHWLVDSIILVRVAGTEGARRPGRILLAHLLQGLLRFLLFLAICAAFWFALQLFS